MEMYIIFNKIIKESEDLKHLISNYPSHKIPVGKIFKNDNVHGSGINYDLMNKIDVFTSDENFEHNSVQTVPIDRIVPTQKFVSKDNLLKVKDIINTNNTGAYLVKYNDYYYVIDGHHRISMKIINGENTVNGFVQEV